MIIETFEQGSPEWFAARAGRPTASNFDKIITTKGEPSKQRQQYLYQLAGEAITGTPEATYSNSHMERGILLESEARAFYEFMTGNQVQQVGMCYQNEDKLFACSPDGLVGEIGGLEIKCPQMSTHIKYLLAGKLPTEYFQQVHGSIFVTGRAWWDFVSYYPGLPPVVVRVERDAEFCKLLEFALNDFCELLDGVKKTIIKMGN